MKRWPFSRKARVLAALIMAAVLFPAVSQSIFDEDFDTYIEYNSALLSEEFLAQDGGDCEDWSIVTAGLLQFWDVPAYVGTLGA